MDWPSVMSPKVVQFHIQVELANQHLSSGLLTYLSSLDYGSTLSNGNSFMTLSTNINTYLNHSGRWPKHLVEKLLGFLDCKEFLFWLDYMQMVFFESTGCLENELYNLNETARYAEYASTADSSIFRESFRTRE